MKWVTAGWWLALLAMAGCNANLDFGTAKSGEGGAAAGGGTAEAVALPPGPVQVLLTNSQVGNAAFGKQFSTRYQFKSGAPDRSQHYFLKFVSGSNNQYDVRFSGFDLQSEGVLTGELSFGEELRMGESSGFFEAYLEMGPMTGNRTRISNTVEFGTRSPSGASGQSGSPVAGGNNPPAEPVKPVADAEFDRMLADLKSQNGTKATPWLARLAATRVNDRQQEVAAALAPLLEGQHVHVRSLAATALETWATVETVPALTKALDDEWNPVQSSAAKALGRLKVAAAAEKIAPLLEDLGTRFAARDALKAIGPPAEPHVVDYLKHTDDSIRSEAAGILQEIATAESVPALIEAADDEYVFVSGPALEALLRLKDERSIELLASKLGELGSSHDKVVRVLKDFGPKAEAAVAEQLKSDEHRVQAAAAELLGSIGTSETVPALIDALSEDWTFTKSAVIATLAKRKDPRAAEPLAPLLGELQYRNDVSRALREIGEPAEAPVLELLETSDDHFTRMECLAVLKAVGTPKSVKPLNQVFRGESNPFVKQEAAETIQIIQRRSKTTKSKSKAR